MEMLIYLLKFALCSMVIFIFLFFGAWLVWKAGQGHARYMEKLIELERYVEHLGVNNENCSFILDKFDEINKEKCRDKEKNKELFVKFCHRFKNVWQERTKDE